MFPTPGLKQYLRFITVVESNKDSVYITSIIDSTTNTDINQSHGVMLGMYFTIFYQIVVSMYAYIYTSIIVKYIGKYDRAVY